MRRHELLVGGLGGEQIAPFLPRAALERLTADEGEDLTPRVSFALFPAADYEVRAEEGALVPRRSPHPELSQNIPRHQARCSGSQGQYRNVAQFFTQTAQPPVGGSEVMSPLRNTVRLVHHDQ